MTHLEHHEQTPPKHTFAELAPASVGAGDIDGDGSIVGTPDMTTVLGWASGSYDVRGDLDLDGDFDRQQAE